MFDVDFGLDGKRGRGKDSTAGDSHIMRNLVTASRGYAITLARNDPVL